MRGHVLIHDARQNRAWNTETVALSDCSVHVLDAATLARVAQLNPGLERAIWHAASVQAAQDHAEHAAMGALGADARVARFMIGLSSHYAALGFSPRAFLLQMTRRDIGSYLGLTLETVCRVLSSLHVADVVKVEQRQIELCDMPALHRIAAGSSRCATPLARSVRTRRVATRSAAQPALQLAA
jgi:CRP/FNR family transcriptional regulator